MAAPTTTPELLGLLRNSRLVEEPQLREVLQGYSLPGDPSKAAKYLVKTGLITRFQAKHLLAGRFKGMVFGPYHLLEMIGQGGTGIVFLAQHHDTKERVAVKVLPSDKARSKEILQRFYREAKAVTQLEHPNIIRGLEVNRWENYHYLVMEYFEGKSFQKIVDERGPIPYLQVSRYIMQVIEGLHHAHLNGLVHRDIKPSNILLDKTGVVKILDFGLARFFDDQDDKLTKDLCQGALLGTADYLSPEQAVQCYNVDIRGDIYSLGATFYTLLVGQPPFANSKLAKKLVDHQLLNPTPPHEIIPSIPPDLSAILQKMMAKKPDHRYQSPAELYHAMQMFLDGKAETIEELQLHDTTDTIKMKIPRVVMEIYQQQNNIKEPLENMDPPAPKPQSQSGLHRAMNGLRALLGTA